MYIYIYMYTYIYTHTYKIKNYPSYSQSALVWVV